VDRLLYWFLTRKVGTKIATLVLFGTAIGCCLVSLAALSQQEPPTAQITKVVTAVPSVGEPSATAASTQEVSQPTRTPSSSNTPGPTSTPSPTPTPFLLSLPQEIRDSEGWSFTIRRIDFLKTVDGASRRYSPENDVFMVMLGEIGNYTDEDGCIKGWDFVLHTESEEYDMDSSVVSAAKDVYDLDYPGFFLGQCLDYDETEESFLVFDVPVDSDFLWLRLNDAEISIGSVSTLQHASVPTFTPMPTRTPRPRSSATVSPTSAPAGVGLGVSRVDIRSVFASPDIGFTFETATAVDGQPRIMGTAPSGLAILELIGPADDLLIVNILAGFPSDNQTIALENAVFMAGALKQAVPDWEGSTDWLSETIGNLPEDGEVTVTRGRAVITLQAAPEFGFLLLSVKATGSPTQQAVPTPKPSKAPTSTPSAQLLADSQADFTGGQGQNSWEYLFSEGRDSFNWKQMGFDGSCYQSPFSEERIRICADHGAPGANGDIAWLYKAETSGKLLFKVTAKKAAAQGDDIEIKVFRHTEDLKTWHLDQGDTVGITKQFEVDANGGEMFFFTMQVSSTSREFKYDPNIFRVQVFVKP
jgi:hypothetical protein